MHPGLSQIYKERISHKGLRNEGMVSNILPLFPWIHIVDSTFHHQINQMVPLSLQNGKRVACFPFVHLFPSCPFNIYKNIFRFIPAICKDCTVSRIPPGFLPTYEPWLIPPRIPKGFADSEQSLRLSGPPFLSRKEQFGMLAQTYL